MVYSYLVWGDYLITFYKVKFTYIFFVIEYRQAKKSV